jgi:hypothetical protein
MPTGCAADREPLRDRLSTGFAPDHRITADPDRASRPIESRCATGSPPAFIGSPTDQRITGAQPILTGCAAGSRPGSNGRSDDPVRGR